MAAAARPIKSAPALQTPLLAQAREVFAAEVRAIEQAARYLDADFAQAVDWLASCQGRIVVTGMGKSGLIGQKISATFASIGAPSLFMHAAEAIHGDLGRLAADDVVLALSNSGQSPEVVRLLEPIRALGARLIGLTGVPGSALGRASDAVLCIGPAVEACPMGLVPTASTAAMLVLGDALAICVLQRRGSDLRAYARRHPGGSLGRKLMRVSEIMRQGEANPVASEGAALREVVSIMSRTPGRPGAASIVDAAGRLVGFFTDGDLRRLLGQPSFDIDLPIAGLMQPACRTVAPDMLVAEAATQLSVHRIDQLPVVDAADRPVGLLDVQDVLRVDAIR
jgi:arabinose-5-phosphate isomerase